MAIAAAPTARSIPAGGQAAGTAQFIIATHFPIPMAIPGAQVLEIDEDGLQEVRYEETLHFQLYKAFLNKPEKMIAETLGEKE